MDVRMRNMISFYRIKENRNVKLLTVCRVRIRFRFLPYNYAVFIFRIWISFGFIQCNNTIFMFGNFQTHSTNHHGKSIWYK